VQAILTEFGALRLIYEPSGYLYLRSDLLAWLRERGNAAETRPHLEAPGGTKTKKALSE
jgi:hypothetical protein